MPMEPSAEGGFPACLVITPLLREQPPHGERLLTWLEVQRLIQGKPGGHGSRCIGRTPFGHLGRCRGVVLARLPYPMVKPAPRPRCS
jgi:hypothetical protein